MLSTLTIFTLVVLTGCSDVVTTRFATLQEAESQGAFARGWLPPALPDTARNIIETNDLDANTGTGSFDYDLTERSPYLKRMTQLGAVLRADGDADVLILTTNGTRWEIRLPQDTEQAYWTTRLLWRLR